MVGCFYLFVELLTGDMDYASYALLYTHIHTLMAATDMIRLSGAALVFYAWRANTYNTGSFN